MKQIFSILLAVLLLASLSAAAFAEAGDEESYDDWDWDNSLAVERPDIGLVLHIPADIGDAFALQGHIEFEYGEELSYGSGAYYTELGYFAMSDEEYEAMDELDDSRYLPLLDSTVQELESHGFTGIRCRLEERCVMIGKPVLVSGGQQAEGIAEGIGEHGELLVRQPSGSLVSVTCGDVSVRGVNGYV